MPCHEHLIHLPLFLLDMKEVTIKTAFIKPVQLQLSYLKRCSPHPPPAHHFPLLQVVIPSHLLARLLI